jgi:hypothetical protein
MTKLSKLYLIRLKQTTSQMIRYSTVCAQWPFFNPFFSLNSGLLLQSTELHIYTDFLRIVLEIINAILTYALPRNPEVCAD